MSFVKITFAEKKIKMKNNLKTGLILVLLLFMVKSIKSQSWLNYNVSNGLANNYVQAILIDKKGIKWFGTYGGGLTKFDGVNWITYTVNDGLVCDYVRSIKVDTIGNLWIGTDGGVSKFDGVNWSNFTTFDGLSNNLVYAIEIDKEGNKWFATNKGVSMFNDASWILYTTDNGLVNNIVTAIEIDALNNKWFGTWGGGISKFDGSSWVSYHQVNFVNTIVADNNGDIWVGTATGLRKFDGNCWTNYPEINNAAPNGVYAITIDFLGNKWFGTIAGGLFKYNGQAFVNYDMNNGLISDLINALAIDKDGNVWVGTDSGVSYYSHDFVNLPESIVLDRFSIYPNPMKNILYLKSSFHDAAYKIFNQLGVCVFNGNLIQGENKINLENFIPGVYMLQVSDSKIKSKLLIKE